MSIRTTDTRRKIQLGGLVIKAGFAAETDAVILGVLTLAANALSGPESNLVRARFSAAGDAAFGESSHAK
jgi:Conjugal transfer protein TraD